VEWVFSTLKSLTTTDENLSKELSKIEEVWDCFAKIVHLFRSTRLLETTEHADLIAFIEDFRELFTRNTTKNPTPEMHSLFSHVEACLKKYGTVGVFAEDYLEFIHALVNRIVAEFQSLDGDHQTKQVLRVLSAESTRAMKHQRREMVKKEEMIAQGKIVKVTRRKRQGMGAHEAFRLDHTLLDASPEATQVLSDKWFEGTAPVSSVFESQQCKTCMDTLNEEAIVPTQLQYLHEIMVHHHVDKRISYKYKN
jgi:DNA-directed RNA polymerase subunit H (RpoH/RPB5)